MVDDDTETFQLGHRNCIACVFKGETYHGKVCQRTKNLVRVEDEHSCLFYIDNNKDIVYVPFFAGTLTSHRNVEVFKQNTLTTVLNTVFIGGFIVIETLVLIYLLLKNYNI